MITTTAEKFQENEGSSNQNVSKLPLFAYRSCFVFFGEEYTYEKLNFI